MSKIMHLPGKKVIKALENIGFEKVRQKGSHLFLRHPDGRTTIVPIYPTDKIGKGMINKIIKMQKLHGING